MLQCPNCHKEFNSTENLPRILVFCGHTFCHLCILAMLQKQDRVETDTSPADINDEFDIIPNSSQNPQHSQFSNKAAPTSQSPPLLPSLPSASSLLHCPECGTVNPAPNGIESFPKNLVLLQVNQQQQANQNNDNIKKQTQEQDKLVQNNQTQRNKANHQSSDTAINSLCQQHSKKLEAFCEKCLETLCIDCILSEQHKSHEIVSVQKGVERQKQYLYEEVIKAQSTEEKLSGIQSEIKKHIGDIQVMSEKNKNDLAQIYQQVRQIIDERESQMKKQIDQNLEKEEQDNLNKLTDIRDFMMKIDELKSELVDQSKENEIQLLKKAKQRQIVSQEVNGAQSKDLLNLNISSISNSSQCLIEVRKELELVSLCKLINPNISSKVLGNGSATPSSTLYSHTMASKMKRNSGAPTINFHQASASSQQNIQSQIPQSLHKEHSSSTPMSQDLKRGEDTSSSAPGNRRTLKQQVNYPSQNHIKNKVSPHRQLPSSKFGNNATSSILAQNANKQQLSNRNNLNHNPHYILNQNDQNRNSSAKMPQSIKTKTQNQNLQLGVQQHSINLTCLTKQAAAQENSNEESIGAQDDAAMSNGGCVGMTEDFSCIYPLEQTECYFQFSPKNVGKQYSQQETLPTPKDNTNLQTSSHKLNKGDLNGGLTDLLERLNKSQSESMDIEPNTTSQGDKKQATVSLNLNCDLEATSNKPNTLIQRRNTMTVTNVESPRKRTTTWIKNGPSIMDQIIKQKKDQDENETTHIQQKNESDIQEQNVYFGGQSKTEKEQDKTENLFTPSIKLLKKSEELLQVKSGALTGRNYQNNNNNLIMVTGDKSNFDEKAKQVLKQAQIGDKLISLSQERQKRKQQKFEQTMSSKESFSPSKVSNSNNISQRVIKQEDREDIVQMLQQCTNNIKQVEQNIQNLHLQKVSKNNSRSPQKLPIESQNSSPSKLSLPLNATNTSNGSQKPQTTVKTVDLTNASIEQFGKEEQQNTTEQLDNSLKDKISNNQLPILPLNNQSEAPGIISLTAIRPDNQSLAAQLQQSCISNDTSVIDPLKAFCKVKEEYLYVFSGFNESKLLYCEALDVQSGQWKEISQITKARTKFSAVPISKSRILIFGGKLADGQRCSEIEEFNLKTNKFKILPFKLPKPRSGFAACVKREEGRIFFCGGNSSAVLRKFDCLDLKKGRWSRWPDMLHKRDELAAALGPDGMIYAIGGYGGGSSSGKEGNTPQSENGENKQQTHSNCLRTAERFNFRTNEWEMLPEMNEARRALAAVALPDGIYAIGGYDGKQYLATVEKQYLSLTIIPNFSRFDLQKQQWVQVKSMNTSRCTLAAVASNDCQYIYAMGGFNGTALDIVERYNIMTDEWEYITPMNHKRFMHEAVSMISQ